MTRFKFMCEQIEIKFFKGTNSFIFGDKPSCIDHIFYQELLAAMILSGNGTQQEFFSADTEARLKKLKGLSKWYKQMANE